MPRAGGVSTRRSDAFFCFHTINAFEAEGRLVVDLCGYDEVSWLQTFRLPHLRSGKATPPAVDIRRCRAQRGARPSVEAPAAVQPGNAVHSVECTPRRTCCLPGLPAGLELSLAPALVLPAAQVHTA